MAGLASVTSVVAADLYVPPSAPPAAPFTWDGPYIGANVGGGIGGDADNLRPIEPPVADAFNLSGAGGGLYGGMNWQNGDLVLGVEGDVDYMNLSGSKDFGALGPDHDLVTGTLSLSTGWQGSLVGRAGYALDRTLLYGLAGVTLAQGTLHVQGSYFDAPYDVSNSQVHVGGTIGLGVEQALTDHLVLRGELRYTGFDDQTYNLGPHFHPSQASWNQGTAMLGISYKF
jgi:outer membrane immunogenic protein